MYAAFAWRTFLQLAFTILAYIVSPLLPKFTQSNGYLPNGLKWFQTFDASLDAGWKDGYFNTTGLWRTFVFKWFYYFPTAAMTPPVGANLYCLRMRWLWRNAAYGFCYWPMGIAYDPKEWYVTVCVINADRTLSEFEAHTLDGKYFCYTNDKGVKLGYKLWWALDADFQLLPRLGADRGPDNRLPICFTPW